MVGIAVVVLFVSAATLAVITAGSVVVRTSVELAGRRLASYRPLVSAQLARYLVDPTGSPPPCPQGRLEQSVMRALLLSVASNVRGEATDRLAALFRGYGLVEPARAGLGARRSLTRIRAAEALGAMGLQEAVPWLREGLGHKDRQLRIACAHSLSALGAISAVGEIDVALRGGGAQVGQRTDVLVGLGAAAIPVLIGDLRAPGGGRQRWLAAEGLGELRAQAAVAELSAALDAGDKELAARAARALGRIGDPGAAAALARALGDERPWFVRAAAAGALGAIDDPAAAPLLVWALASAHWDLRDAAARALVALGDAVLGAVTEQLDVLSDDAVAHFVGTCDAAGILDQIVADAAAGDPARDALVRRAARAGITAALGGVAAGDDRLGRYAAGVLTPPHAARGAEL